MIDETTHEKDAVAVASSNDGKMADDDPTLAIPTQPPRKVRTAAVVAALATLTLAGVAFGAYLHGRSQRAPISEEPKGPTLPRGQAIPGFLAGAPSMPTPIHVEAQRPPATLPPVPVVEQHLSTRPSVNPLLERAHARQAELDETARSAGIFFRTDEAASRRAAAEEPRGEVPSSPRPPDLATSAAAAAGAGTAAASWDPNLQDHKDSFLHSARRSPDYLPTSLQSPISPYELKASSIIPVTLIDGINSDLPGPVSAQVRERVFDTVTGEHLLIPQGARLFGWYDSKVAWGQDRVLLCWDRIIFPNGKSINLQCMPAGDLQGQAGLADQVDNHYDRLMAAVGLSTILAVGTQAAAGNPTGYQPTLAQTAAQNAAGQINNAGQAIVARQLNTAPTITIRPGFAANLRVTKDIILEPYRD